MKNQNDFDRRPATADEVISGKAKWCFACDTVCQYAGGDHFMMCIMFASNADDRKVRELRMQRNQHQ